MRKYLGILFPAGIRQPASQPASRPASQPAESVDGGRRGGGRFVTYSRGGEFNSFRYKYISSGRAAREITFTGIMAKTAKTSAEITTAEAGIEFCARPRAEL